MTLQKIAPTDGWEILPLNRKLILKYGKGLPEDQRISGKYPVFGSNGIVGYHNRHLVEGPGIVVGRKGTVGAVTFAETDFWPIDTTYFVSLRDVSVNLRWLYYKLGTLDLASLNTATGVPGLNRDVAYSLSIAWPDPAEQSKIAAVLSYIDRAISTSDSLIQKLQRTAQGFTQDLLTRGIDEKGNVRTENIHRFKDSPLGRIPDGWNVLPLGSVAESLIDGPFGSNLKTEHYVSQPGVRVVRLQNLEIGQYNDDDKAFVSERWASRLRRHKVVSDDVLIAAMGDDNHPIARASLYPTGLPPAINKADCFRLRCRSSVMVNAFAMYSLNAEYCRPEITRLVQGVTRMRINVTNVKQVRLKAPSVGEQVRIVERLRNIDVAIQRERAILMKFKRMKQGVMDDLLTGKVRVKNLLKQ
jgi:type I restriction enzyme S subunit